MIKTIIGWFTQPVKEKKGNYLVFNPNDEIRHPNHTKGYLDAYSCQGHFFEEKRSAFDYITDEIPKSQQKDVLFFTRIKQWRMVRK